MRKMRYIVKISLVLCIIFLATSPFAATKMPNFSLVDVVSGETVDSSSFEGKALFVTFFASWCPPCMQEVPTLIKLQKSYQDQDFSVIGLSVEIDNRKGMKKLVKKKSINYPVMMADGEVMQNFGGVYGIPVSFLINKSGNVVKKYTGYIAQSVLEKDLKKVL